MGIEKNLSKESELKTIVDFVESYRSKRGIIPTSGIKFEPSCIAFGEGHNLLYAQLMNTTNGTGGWLELEDSEVRGLVLEQIGKDRKYFDSS